MAFLKGESEKKREHELHIVGIFSRSIQQVQILQPQQAVTSQIESQFLTYHMQTAISTTRRESDTYQPQQSRTSDHFGNMQNRTFFPY